MIYKYIPSQVWMTEVAEKIGFTPLEIRIVMEAFHEYFSTEASRTPLVLELKNSSVCDREFILKKFSNLSEKEKKIVMLTATRKSYALHRVKKRGRRYIKRNIRS